MAQAKLYTPKQFSRRLGITNWTCLYWIRTGRIKAIHLSRKTIRIPHEQLERLLSEAAHPVFDFKRAASGEREE